MDLANSLIQLINNLWGLASTPLGYICNLKANVNWLRNASDNLKAKSEDVLATVEREEGGGGMQRTKQVENWLGKVQTFVGQVDQILREAGERDQIKCLSRCLPPNCWLSYKLGKRVDQMLNEARELQVKGGEFEDVTAPSPPPPVLEMPMDMTVGLDISKLNKVWKWVMDENQVGVIGLYGTGGVGKTTLMTRINNELFHTNNRFEIVIWAVVSRLVNEDSIRDVIRKRLHIKDESWEKMSREARVHHLREVLTRKKFLLLIDDVWGRLDLSKIGVHPSDLKNGSKVVFTTRLKQVCDQMKADKNFEVQCLKPEEAHQLFENNVGKSTVHYDPEIQELAKNIVQECRGLPLAIVIVGRAMVSKYNPGEWRHALTMLRNNPHKLSGMVEEVYHILKFSYDSLHEPTHQRCFLYCCLFPEDYPIGKQKLIELWIGEGLLGDTGDVYSMRDEGESILGDLKRACLLGSERDEYGQHYVKMHDVVRDMATWITRDCGQNENKLLVIENEEDMSTKMISKWREAEKVSLWGTRIGNIDRTPFGCSRLETLFVRETHVSLLPRGFFNSMKARLIVLDLSDNGNIKLFPEEICNLIYLQYLNLSATCISELPRGIKNLTRLRWLLLDNTSKHFLIPTGAITSLPLNSFSKWVRYDKTFGHDIVGSCSHPSLSNEKEIIEELERMQHLTDLSIVVSEASSVMKIFQSPNLQKCIRRVKITDRQKVLTHIKINYSPTGNGVFSHLQELFLQECDRLLKMEITQGIGQAPNCLCFPSLVKVCVQQCSFSDLSWLVHAPKLQELSVSYCHRMRKIIGDEFAPEELAASRLFSHLKSLTLSGLSVLTSIYDQTLPFSQLERLIIQDCDDLEKLPLDPNITHASLKVVLGRRLGRWGTMKWVANAGRAISNAKVTIEYFTPFGDRSHHGSGCSDLYDNTLYMSPYGSP